MHEDWIDAKTKLSIEVISKEGDDLTWHKLNGEWCVTILRVDEIIQLYFNNPEKTKSRDENECAFKNSVDDDGTSCGRCSDIEDSMGMEHDDVHDFDCNHGVGIDSWRLKHSAII